MKWSVVEIQHCTLTSPTSSCVRLFGVAPGRVMVLWAFLLAAMAPLVLLAGRRLPATVPDHNRHDNPTVETLIDMQKLGASLTRRESDCAWLRSLPLCTTEHPNNRTAWCKCALFAEVNNGSCALHGNLTDGECSRRGGVAVSAKPHPTFGGQATCECHRNATSLRNAETRPAGFSAEVVISHCVHPMEWLGGFLSELSRANATVVRITIIAKCGLSGASYAYGDLPAGMPSPQLQERENVGRCDHAWASYFHANRSTLASRIFCLKDSYQAHTMFPPVLARDLVEGSHDGFACAYRMLDLRHRHPKAWEPTLCDVSDMGRWQLATYDKPHDQNRNRNRNQNQNRTQTQGPSPSPRHENRTDGFAATPHRPYGTWARALLGKTVETMHVWHRAAGEKARPMWPTCYGGGFATTREAVHQVPRASWRAMARSMERADNVEESHFMERTWAALLSRSRPLASSEPETHSSIHCSTRTFKQAVDKLSGRVYYWDVETRKSVYTLPDFVVLDGHRAVTPAKPPSTPKTAPGVKLSRSTTGGPSGQSHSERIIDQWRGTSRSS